MADLAAETVAKRLRDRDTRSATLAALEGHSAPIPTPVSLAAAPALVGLMSMGAAEVERDVYDRAGLLLAKLHAEALPDNVAVHGAAFGEGGYERVWNADSVLNKALRQPAAQLTRADAVSYACSLNASFFTQVRGATKSCAAAGLTALESIELITSAEPMAKKKQPEDDVPAKMLILLIELLKANELPELAITGAWGGFMLCLTGRPSLVSVVLEHGAVELAVTHLKAIGSPADWVSISRGRAGRSYGVTGTLSEITKSLDGEAACVASAFDLCIEAIKAVAAAGVDGLQDTSHSALYFSLSIVLAYRAQPGCEGKIRGAANALSFCLMHDLDHVTLMGASTATAAAQICCSVFGRDEGGSDFSFSAQHVQLLVTRWSGIIRADGFARNWTPNANVIMALELCISDSNKPLLLANADFLPYVVDALLLEADHPRADLKPELKSWCQQHHAECLAQLAIFAPARKTLRADPSVIPALEAVAEGGLTAKARQFAESALLALSDKELHVNAEGQKHVMLSYQWDSQVTLKRINESLIERGYVTWFDLTNMKGSTVDAMSEAIEGADIMMYGVSLRYKESTNCRMEANYAHQQELDMIPLMMQENYRPQGWLGLIMGTRLWYQFWDAESDDDAAFERRLDVVVREIGDRGKIATAMVSESVPPKRVPAKAPSPADATGRATAATPTSAPAPAPIPARVGTPERAVRPDHSFAPSVQMTPAGSLPSSQQLLQPAGYSTDTAVIVQQDAVSINFMREEREHLMHQLNEQRKEMQARIDAKDAKLEELRDVAKLEELRDVASAMSCVSQGQLELLQTRFDALHQAKLLSDDEIGALEDCIADYIECRSSLSMASPAELTLAAKKISVMVGLSEGIGKDGMLARQLRRKFAAT